MAGRTFTHYSVAFERDVVEYQTVDVAVDSGLSAELGRSIALELAPGRLKERGWVNLSVSEPKVTEAAVASPTDEE